MMHRADRNRAAKTVVLNSLDDPAMEQDIPASLLGQLREEVEMPALDPQSVLESPNLVR